MTWPPYGLIAAAFAAGSSVIAGLVAGGNTIFCAASWVCTSVLTTECPHSSRPPAAASTIASTRPAVVASASNVLLRISGASLARRRARGPAQVFPLPCPPRGPGPARQGRKSGPHGTSVPGRRDLCQAAGSPARHQDLGESRSQAAPQADARRGGLTAG